MHSQRPVLAFRSRNAPRSRRLTLLPISMRWTLCLCGLFWTISLSSQGAENLWLDVARASITTNELHGHVSVLADDLLEGREAGSRGGRVAAKYIIERLEAAELQPAGTNGRFTQPFSRNYQNLLAVLPGNDPELSDEYLVVGAHYDHVGYGNRRNSYGPWGYIHNGADDNASGVAAVLEVIDALARTEHRPRRSILFAFWDGEEKGLLGSKHWKQNPTLSLGAVRLAINVDMVGRLTDGRIEVGGTRSAVGSRQVLSSPRLDEGLWLDFNWEYKDNSDHWTFFEAGIPSLYVHTGIHDDYHRPSDDVEKLNVDGIRQVSAYLLEQLTELADVERLPEFRSEASRETPSNQRRQEKSLPKLAPRIDFAWRFVPGSQAAAVVDQIPWQSRAKLAGLAIGDRIVAVNGMPITSEALLPATALRTEAELQLQIERPGNDSPQTILLPLMGSPTRLGLSWRSDPAEPDTVYVTRVVPYSPAALAGLQLHDRVHTLNNNPVLGADNLLSRVRQLLEGGTDQLHLEVESRGTIRDVVVPLGLPTVSSGDATL